MQSRSRILVIDDDPMFRSLVVSLLRKDYLVSVAADGESGFNKAREHRPDLAIIDFQMPGWNGVRTLRMFRTDRSLALVKVVMLTSDASKDTVLAAIQAGTDDYIIKTSFQKQEFLVKIGKLLVPQVAKPVVPEAPAAPFNFDQTPLFFASVDDSESLADENRIPVQRDDSAATCNDEESEFALQPAADSEDERLSEIMDEWE